MTSVPPARSLRHPLRAVTAAAGLAAVLSGCSPDLLIWGPEGSQVIARTDEVIASAQEGDLTSYLCEGADPEMGTAEDWQGLNAEEPERYSPMWAEVDPGSEELGPTWTINLSDDREQLTAGTRLPGQLYFTDGDDGLCVTHVGWVTVG